MKTIKQYTKVKIINIPQHIEYTILNDKITYGDIGTVIEIYDVIGKSKGYEVECTNSNGKTKWLATFHENDIEPI